MTDVPQTVSNYQQHPGFVRDIPFVVKGFTLIELILVISILSLLGVIVTPFATRFVGTNNLEVATDQILGSIRKAQAYSMDGKDDSNWGVCLVGGDTVRMFSDSCASLGTSEDFVLPGNVSVSGFTETSFSKRRGEPSNALSIVVDNNIDVITIDMNIAGGLDVN